MCDEETKRKLARHLYVSALRRAMHDYLVECVAHSWHEHSNYTTDEIHRLDEYYDLTDAEKDKR